jgi:protease II
VLVAHRPEVKLQAVGVSQHWLMIQERYRAQQAVQVYRLPADGSMPQSLGAGERMEFDEPAYDLSGGKG